MFSLRPLFHVATCSFVHQCCYLRFFIYFILFLFLSCKYRYLNINRNSNYSFRDRYMNENKQKLYSLSVIDWLSINNLKLILGCILCELLTGYPLLPGEDEGAYFRRPSPSLTDLFPHSIRPFLCSRVSLSLAIAKIFSLIIHSNCIWSNGFMNRQRPVRLARK